MSKTNGDHIRTLSDEDLAALLLGADAGDFTVDICASEFADPVNCPHVCDSCALRFLQASYDEAL